MTAAAATISPHLLQYLSPSRESRLSGCMGVRRVKSLNRRDPRRIKEGREYFCHSFLSSC